MQFFSPQTEKIRREVREWALDQVRPLAREADTNHCPPKNCAEVLNNCPILFGGVSRDPRAAEAVKADGANVLQALITEDVAFGDHWPMFSEGVGIGFYVVNAMGTPAQRERWVVPVQNGLAKSAFALTESHFGSDPSQVATTARLEGNTWVINGTKMYCSGGASADYVVVFATIDKSAGRHGIRAFIVEKGTPGATVTKPNEDKLGIRCSETSEISYVDCAIPVDHCLGFEEEKTSSAKPAKKGGERKKSGFLGALGAMTTSRPLLGGMAIGLARASHQVARDWAAEHRSDLTAARRDRMTEEFDRMEYALDHASRLVHRAMWEKDRKIQNRRTGSAAKAFAPPIAERVIRRCVQLMGPDGTSQEYLVEKWYRDVKIFDIFEGSGQIQRITIARELMGAGAARG